MNFFCKRVKAVRRYLRKNNDPEIEQALVRVLIEVSLSFYILVSWDSSQSYFDILKPTENLVVLSTTLLAIMTFTLISINPRISPSRRVFGIFLDLIPLSILMSIAVTKLYIYLFFICGSF